MGLFDSEPTMRLVYDESLNDDVIREIFIRRFPEYSVGKFCGLPKLKKSVFHQAYVTLLPGFGPNNELKYMDVNVCSYDSSILRVLMGYIIYDIIQGSDKGEFITEVTNVIKEELGKRYLIAQSNSK